MEHHIEEILHRAYGDLKRPWTCRTAVRCQPASPEQAEPDLQLAGTPDVAVTESAVDRHMEAGVRARLQSIPDWRGLNNPWMPNDEEEVQYSYINLQQNPERFTGYQVSAIADPVAWLAVSCALICSLHNHGCCAAATRDFTCSRICRSYATDRLLSSTGRISHEDMGSHLLAELFHQHQRPGHMHRAAGLLPPHLRCQRRTSRPSLHSSPRGSPAARNSADVNAEFHC